MYDDQGPITTNPSKDQPLGMTIGGGQLAAMQTSTFWSSPSRNLSTTLNKKKTALLFLIQIKLDWMKSIILILTAIYWKTSYGGGEGKSSHFIIIVHTFRPKLFSYGWPIISRTPTQTYPFGTNIQPQPMQKSKIGLKSLKLLLFAYFLP